MKVIANAKDPKFSNTKVEIYRRIISKVDCFELYCECQQFWIILIT